MLKKIVSILLLFTIIFNMAGIFFAFKIEQAHIRSTIKHEIKDGIPNDELHEFNLSQEEYKELNWTRKDIEFRMHKEMFDIVRRKSIGDSIQLQCVNDKEETLLFAQLDKMIQNIMNQESQTPNSPINKIVKVLKVVYVNDFSTYVIESHPLKTTAKFADLKYAYLSPYYGVPTPPPETV